MNRLTQFFPLIAGTASALALWRPEIFTWFGPLFIKISLALIMFFTGLSLTVADFRRIALNPAPVAVGFGLQYTVMPFMGWLAAEAFQLPREVAAGLILVACCPGGTASNIITYLARADVPLSVSHFPKVDKLTDMGDGVYKWEMEKVGTAQVNIQTVYASKYVSDKAKGTVKWTPVKGVGNAQVGGGWKITDNKGKSTQIELKIKGTVDVPLPGLMKMIVVPVVEGEFEKLVDKYVANLIKKFGGEV